MPIEEEPIVGAVYENDEGRTFEVIAFDEDDGEIKVRYEDESVKALDIDDWYEMELTRISSPEEEKTDDDEDFEDDFDEDEEEDDDEDEDFDEDDDEEE
jgi:hypothetical protein